MNNYFNFLKEIFFRLEKRIILIFLAIIFILGFSLFISEFNLLKLVNFITMIIVAVNLFFYFQLLKKPKEEKIEFFKLVQELLDNCKEGIVIYNDDYKIVFVNKSLAEIANLKKEDIVNLTVQPEMMKNKKYEMLANIFFPFIQGQDLQIISQNPEIIEVRFISPVEKYFLISYLDVYLDRKYKLRIVLDKTEDVLVAQQKLAFVRLVSHHLLTPLAELRWNLEAVNLENLPPEDKKFLQAALRSIKNTLLFAESLLNLARIEMRKIVLNIQENINLENLILSLLDVLKDKIETKGIKVNIEIEEKAAFIPGDESILKVAIFSILQNAVVYNKIGGEINIFIRKQVQRPYTEIIVEDTGIGMTEEDLKNIFKKYYRGKKAKEMDANGFGIGLYNAKYLINLHGGEIQVQSQENVGTTVKIYLPLDSNLIPKQ